MKLTVIIPTFNEVDSIKHTVVMITKVIPKDKLKEILICDDNSPDGTWVLAERLSKKYPVRCIRRMKNRGLSQSVIEGLVSSSTKYNLVMDADGQHDINVIPDMYKELQSHSVVIGSRFVRGGSVEGWGKFRLFQSKVASSLSKLFLKNSPADPMAGFFIVDKSIFKKVHPHLWGKGYKILLDILLQAQNNGVDINFAEVPYKFKTRKHGQSKLGSKVISDYLQMLFRQFQNHGFKK